MIRRARALASHLTRGPSARPDLWRNALSERPDDTTEKGAAERARREPAPTNYYDDDGTGYEVYDPGEEEEDDAVPGGEESERRVE